MIRKIIFVLSVLAFYTASLLFAERYGYNDGYTTATQECQKADIKKLEEVLDITEQLVADANKASLALGQTINDRIATDNKTTQEIRRALSTTTHLRVDCKLPADVMRQLTAARERANQAAASGIDRAVPAITRTD